MWKIRAFGLAPGICAWRLWVYVRKRFNCCDLRSAHTRRRRENLVATKKMVVNLFFDGFTFVSPIPASPVNADAKRGNPALRTCDLSASSCLPRTD